SSVPNDAWAWRISRTLGMGGPLYDPGPMSDYTIKNLREVEDSAPGAGLSEMGEARFAMGELDSETIGLAHQVLKPGKRQPFAHRHDQAEEVYVILSGRGRIKLDDEAREVGPLDAVRVAPGVLRSFEASDEGLEI